ncbi:MAG: hypothetical protein WCI51_01625 [Lentisphaerota bacterium]
MANLNIELNKFTGTEIRRLNGGNLGPQFSHYLPELEREFAELEIPLIRLHDAPWMNPGMRLVDIQHIFGNFKADAQDPDNYYFAQTDEYIRKILEAGSKVMYRLGTSIEHSRPKFFVFPPPDFEKWTDICINIIRHYNEGWNNGFHWNIQYWEIWNEPDGGKHCAPNPSLMWNGTAEQFCDLYEAASTRIKARFPKIKIGAASFRKLNDDPQFMQKFYERCRDKKLPLDFFSWHRYSGPNDPFGIINEPSQARKTLEAYGFKNTELHLAEWRYMHDWGDSDYATVRAAVHAAATLCAWQDTSLDMGEFYTIGCNIFDAKCWGCWNLKGKSNIYHAFKAFAELAHFPKRVSCASDTENFRILAGRDAGNGFAALITDYMTPDESIFLNIGNADLESIEVFLLDSDTKMGKIIPEISGRTIVLKTPKDNASLYLLTGKYKFTPEIK